VSLNGTGSKYLFSFDPSVAPVDDRYEKNDTLETAYDLRSYEQTWLSAVDGKGVQRDVDWYHIAVDAGLERIQALCNANQLGLTFGLYDTNGVNLFEATPSTSLRLEHTVSIADSYFLRIAGDDQGKTYDILWDDLPLLPATTHRSKASYDVRSRERKDAEGTQSRQDSKPNHGDIAQPRIHLRL